jgi:hypothetical protein
MLIAFNGPHFVHFCIEAAANITNKVSDTTNKIISILPDGIYDCTVTSTVSQCQFRSRLCRCTEQLIWALRADRQHDTAVSHL